MKEKEAIRKELEELAPGLSRIGRKQPFHTPPTYFRELPDEILEKVHEQRPSSRLLTWLEGLFGTPARLAWQLATVAVLVVVGFWAYHHSRDTIDYNYPTIADLSIEEVELYVDNHIDEFDVDILLEESNLEYTDVPLLILDSNDVIEDEYLEEILDDLDLEDLEKLL